MIVPWLSCTEDVVDSSQNTRSQLDEDLKIRVRELARSPCLQCWITKTSASWCALSNIRFEARKAFQPVHLGRSRSIGKHIEKEDSCRYFSPSQGKGCVIAVCGLDRRLGTCYTSCVRYRLHAGTSSHKMGNLR